jgi:hypothetical protein
MSIYSLFNPSSSGGQGLRAPAPPPSYSGGSANYSLAPSSGSGGQGLQPPAPAPAPPPSNIYTPPSYSLAPQSGSSGGLGLQAPSFQTPSYAPAPSGAQGGAWWDAAPSMPSMYAPMYTPMFSAGAGTGLGLSMPQAQDGAPGSSLRMGSGAQGAGGGTFTGSAPPITAAPAQAGVTGSFGVNPQQQMQGMQQRSMLEQPLTPETQAVIDRVNAGVVQEPGMMRQAGDWLRDPANQNMVRLGIQGLGALAGYQQQREANRQIQQQVQRGDQAFESQVEANQQNQAVAQRLNQEAMQSFDEARSLYNPQEMAIRGLAQTRGTTQRNIQQMRQELARRGLSPAAIEAEVRRAQVAGAAGESTAFTAGLDTGRRAQQQALSGARALTQTVPGLQYTPSASVADYYARQGAATSQNLRDMLESYLGYPTLQAQEEARRRMQEGSTR